MGKGISVWAIAHERPNYHQNHERTHVLGPSNEPFTPAHTIRTSTYINTIVVDVVQWPEGKRARRTFFMAAGDLSTLHGNEE